MKLDASGFEELAAEFEQMASEELDQLEKDAVKAGAESVRDAQQANWNRSSADGEHVQDAIRIGRPFETDEGMGINVGPKISLRWRAKFVEYGTSYQAPQSPVERSLQQSESTAADAMMKVLERVIK